METELFEVIEKIGFPIVFCLVFIFRLDAKMQKLIELNYKIIELLHKVKK
jgi:hypothetical protein